MVRIASVPVTGVPSFVTPIRVAEVSPHWMPVCLVTVSSVSDRVCSRADAASDCHPRQERT